MKKYLLNFSCSKLFALLHKIAPNYKFSNKMSFFGHEGISSKIFEVFVYMMNEILSHFHTYCISANSFCGNYSFLNFEIQRSQYINLRKLFKGGNYSRAKTIWGNTAPNMNTFGQKMMVKRDPEKIFFKSSMLKIICLAS